MNSVRRQRSAGVKRHHCDICNPSSPSVRSVDIERLTAAEFGSSVLVLGWSLSSIQGTRGRGAVFVVVVIVVDVETNADDNVPGGDLLELLLRLDLVASISRMRSCTLAIRSCKFFFIRFVF